MKFIVNTIIILFSTYMIFYIIYYAEAGENPISEQHSGGLGIIGGHNVSIKDFPYHVSISWLLLTTGEIIYLCGGSIVSANYILSAAHGIKGRDPKRIVVYAGSDFRTNGTIIPISEIIGHPDFSFKTLPMDKDVAVMKTVNPITFTDVIQPVKLPRMHTPLEDNSLVTVCGWGLISLKEDNNGTLRAVDLPVVNFYECWTTYTYNLTRNMWCAGNFESGGIATCYGDSGGAVVQNGVVYGIVSWAESCAQPKNPSVFTDVAAPAIREFITLHTGL